jgi:hypothetical protein
VARVPTTAAWLTAKRTLGNQVGNLSEEIATREEVLALLSEKARSGSISAAIALERALRLGGDDEKPEDDDLWAELDALRPRRNLAE